MDRPEDVEPHPHTGRVYLALTNNTDRGKAGAARTAPADEPNPRNNNAHGHVIELVEEENDARAQRFGWSILLLCGDPKDPSTYFGGFDRSQVSPITSPDNLAFDGHGNLWIATDSGQALSINDGLYGCRWKARPAAVPPCSRASRSGASAAARSSATSSC
jgi:uncharacterized protein